MKTIEKIQLKIFIAVKNCFMLHGGVFVMSKMCINSKRILPAPVIIITIFYCLNPRMTNFTQGALTGEI